MVDSSVLAHSANANDQLVQLLREQAGQHALFLDFDGTLVDLAPTPDSVHVPCALPDLLVRLTAALNGALAIVSGREIADIDRFLARPEFIVAGSHGATIRAEPSGQPEVMPNAPMLDATLRTALNSLATELGCVAEDKGYSVALHYRQAPGQANRLKARIDALLTAQADAFRPVVMTGKMVYEIKFDTYNKGTALDCLMKRSPFAGRRPVFIGDDTTDIYGFERAHALGGIGFSVGRCMPHASAVFDSAQALRNTLMSSLHGGQV